MGGKKTGPGSESFRARFCLALIDKQIFPAVHIDAEHQPHAEVNRQQGGAAGGDPVADAVLKIYVRTEGACRVKGRALCFCA